MTRKTTKYAVRYKTARLLATVHERRADRLNRKADEARGKARHHEQKGEHEYERLFQKWIRSQG